MFSIIVACDKEKGIGKNGDLPWNLKGDMKHFSETTKGVNFNNNKNIVIMGRKTYESIPEKFRPLKNRINIVITKNKAYKVPEDVFVQNSFESALNLAREIGTGETFVIGGSQIYTQAFKHPNLNKLYLTKIEHSFDCDTFIDFNIDEFKKTKVLKYAKESDVFYTIEIYNKKS